MDQIHTIKELCCDSLPHEGQAGHARSAHTTAEICGAYVIRVTSAIHFGSIQHM